MLQYLANTMGREREEDWFAPQVFMKGMEFLEAARGDQPFFLVVDNYDPHEPWDPPEKYTSLYDEGYGGQEPWTSSSGPSDWLTERQLQRMRGLYSGEVTMMDTWLGNFLDKMAELNLFENTLLILLSDHGHAFGEHGFAGKVPAALYPELTDITYMIRHPSGKGAGQTSDYFASTHDVAPTVLGALGIEAPPRCRARTSRCCSTAATPSSRANTSRPATTTTSGPATRTTPCSPPAMAPNLIFDLREDPEMKKNIAGSNADIVKRMYNDYLVKDAGGPIP